VIFYRIFKIRKIRIPDLYVRSDTCKFTKFITTYVRVLRSSSVVCFMCKKIDWLIN